MTVRTTSRRSVVSTVRIAYNNFVAETFVGRLRTGPAGTIAFSPVPGVIFLADPCGHADAVEVRIAWQALDHRDLDLVFPMLQALYGDAVARAALQRYDSEVAVAGGRRTRAHVHRLLNHIDAMDRDHDSELLTALWWIEADVIAGRIDPRVPLSRARAEWNGWPAAAGSEHLAEMGLLATGAVPSGVVALGAEAGPLADVRQRLVSENGQEIVKWCEGATPSTDRPDDAKAEAIAAAMLALRIERLGHAECAMHWWHEARERWASQGEAGRAELAGHRAARTAAGHPPAGASLGELAGVARGSSSSYGYRPPATVACLL